MLRTIRDSVSRVCRMMIHGIYLTGSLGRAVWSRGGGLGQVSKSLQRFV